MKSISPLRYPGGKAKFYDNIIKIFENNKIVLTGDTILLFSKIIK